MRTTMKKALSILTSRRFLLILTAIGITTTYCIFPSPFYLVLPLYISLFVGMLTSKANRYAFLIGGLNSILYTITYISFGTYMQAFYAFFFSFSINEMNLSYKMFCSPAALQDAGAN